VYYDCQLDRNGVALTGGSRVPQFLLEWLGKDFFHRPTGAGFFEVLPVDWDESHEWSVFDAGCLVPDTVAPRDADLYSPHGDRKPIWPTAATRVSSSDWARTALRQRKFGCSCATFLVEYCRNALKLDPHNVEANLLLAEIGISYGAVDEQQRRAHLETVVRYADPKSLEHAHAQKLLAGKRWTFAELYQRIGPDGVLR
jgi:hypothetical protein